MSLTIINEIIKNQDVSLHIYNYYLIFKYFRNKDLTKKNLYLFLNYFKNKSEYYDLIIDIVHIDSPIVKRMIVNDLILGKMIKKHPYIIKYLDDNYKNNEMIIKEVCYFNSYYFKYASNELKYNIKLIL